MRKRIKVWISRIIVAAHTFDQGAHVWQLGTVNVSAGNGLDQFSSASD